MSDVRSSQRKVDPESPESDEAEEREAEECVYELYDTTI